MEILASLLDINTHLPSNIKATDSLDDIQVDAQRLIKAQLTATYSSAIVVTWVNPDTTPGLIRGIAGRLIASKWYAVLVSQGSADEIPGYSINLYREALSLLADLKSGATDLLDDAGNIITGTDLGSDPQNDMYPNDSASGPFFTVDRVFS